ncbi:hypothetical protein THIAE_07895 [Thiomicrospira aerophila AL3]|uniref:PIN domain-containing protein n=1 Tax=Thiomicrospira aerophila AL3 TaxID=717772 RepID=W0DUS0_9GAMM|nr:hypothetical protein [Thiomicrospira aerophila]AHF02345.1 hypothetical protein THIAE_07895 [Thiomicrospira aerophila AL3]
MSAKAFLDTNILIYAFDQDQIKKQRAMHLIVATALGAKCDNLYSEDLQHGLVIDNQLQVINPFRRD